MILVKVIFTLYRKLLVIHEYLSFSYIFTLTYVFSQNLWNGNNKEHYYESVCIDVRDHEQW